jgi:uncharacterized protein (DUF1015 family)
MAKVVPFCGILYNPKKISDLSLVVAPPYDVISKAQQDAFYAAHENNVIRLILNKAQANDSQTENPHTRAARHFEKWLAEGILVRDEKPAFYVTSQSFSANNIKHSRLGLIARIRLEAFDKGVVRPHEKTFSQVKSERLGLFKQCHSNFSQVFSLFPDEDGAVYSLMQKAVEKGPKDIAFAAADGQEHALVRLTDEIICKQITAALADRELFIADGHHRYETALNYLGWLEETQGPLPDDHPARFVMMYLSSMNDPGLVILPAHRVLSRLEGDIAKGFFGKADEYFHICKVEEKGKSPEQMAREIDEKLKEAGRKTAIAAILAQDSPVRILTLKEGVMESLFGKDLERELQDLDVSALTMLIFEKMLGLKPEDLDDHDFIHYTTSALEVYNDVRSGRMAAGFVINPTRIEQVRAVARAGLTMPRKSTYFYPKVITGMVINTLKQ